MDFSLTDEQRAIQETAREFARREVDPIVDEIDESQKFPREVMAKAGELGFLGVIFPEEYGGAGLGYVDYVLIINELSQGRPLGRDQRRRPQLPVHQPHLQGRQRRAARALADAAGPGRRRSAPGASPSRSRLGRRRHAHPRRERDGGWVLERLEDLHHQRHRRRRLRRPRRHRSQRAAAPQHLRLRRREGDAGHPRRQEGEQARACAPPTPRRW